jgi:exopolysaccharide biosynthesis polyprenyl glycosylphosphotransferase
MLANVRLRSESGTLVKVLHVLDCLLAAALLPALTWAHQVSWGRDYTSLALFILCITYLLFYSAKLYQPWRGVAFYREFLAIVKAWVVILGLVFFALFLTKTSEQFSRRVLLSWAVIGPGAVYGLHVLARYFLRMIRKKGYNVRKAVIVGAGDLGFRFARYLEHIPWSGIRIQGFFDDRKTSRDVDSKECTILGTIDELPTYLAHNDIDYVYIALPMRAEKRINSVLERIRSQGALIYIIPDLFAYRMLNSEVQSLGNLVLISLNPVHSYKRYFDIVFSLAVLFLGSPVFALIALLIKLEDGGPVFYRHGRLTLAGRKFGCLKFRTMVQDADAKLKELLENDPQARDEWQSTFKLKNDPRITRVGKWLRVSSLDELPQFWNVLKGEMSVVGARPIVAQELHEYYNGSQGLYCSIKPGVTGPWQVGGRSDTEDYDERVRMDSEYILNRTMWLDIKIICKTVWKVLKREGAY